MLSAQLVYVTVMIAVSNVLWLQLVKLHPFSDPNLPDDGNDSGKLCISYSIRYIKIFIYVTVPDVGLIVGCIAAAVLVIVIAVIFALIAFYYVNKSMGEHSTQNPKPQDQLNTRLTAMPRFSGSML